MLPQDREDVLKNSKVLRRSSVTVTEDLSKRWDFATVVCAVWYLRIVSFNGKSVFNRMLGNGQSNLNGFNSNQMLQINPLAHLWAPTRKKSDFGRFWPKCASIFLAIFFHLWANSLNLQGLIRNIRDIF